MGKGRDYIMSELEKHDIKHAMAISLEYFDKTAEKT